MLANLHNNKKCIQLSKKKKKERQKGLLFFKKKKHLNFSVYLLVAMLSGMQDLSSLTRDQTCDPCTGNMES